MVPSLPLLSCEMSTSVKEIPDRKKNQKSYSKCTRIWMAENQSWCVSGFNSWSSAFSIYINDLSDNLEPNVKLFADDTSMFSGVRDPINTSQKLWSWKGLL